MDQTVAAARITNDPIARGYRTYYGESVDEVKEEDMSGAFGYEETKDMDGRETFEYFRDELKMDEPDAWDRTIEQGKDPSGKKDKNSQYKNDKNFVTRATLSEIQKQKAIKMVEDLLMKNKNSDNSEVGKKKKNEEEVPFFLKKNIKSLVKQMEKQGYSKKDLIKMLSGE
jgi:DNA-binding transcriptional regulator YhcF (GntR family)